MLKNNLRKVQALTTIQQPQLSQDITNNKSITMTGLSKKNVNDIDFKGQRVLMR